jgi:hypothetical protein
MAARVAGSVASMYRWRLASLKTNQRARAKRAFHILRRQPNRAALSPWLN